MWPQHWPMYSIRKRWLVEMNDPKGKGMYIVYNYQVPLQDRWVQIVNKVQISNSFLPVFFFLNACELSFRFNLLHAVSMKHEQLTSSDISLPLAKNTNRAVWETFTGALQITQKCAKYVCVRARKTCTLPLSNLGDLRQRVQLFGDVSRLLNSTFHHSSDLKV